SESIPILKIFLICLIINFIGVSYGYPAFAIINRIDVANKTVYMGGLFQISSLLYLYVNDIISANSVAISVLMTETFVMCLRILFYYIFSKNAHD
ncbi:O100 family O-antigen flippase, partial [Escherichia coli]|nr:O100 family O-antigen flippase [Escherichia coli]